MESGNFWNEKSIEKHKVEIIQINLGNRCNQNCAHCHIDASPAGNKNMSRETAIKIIDKLKSLDINNIEFTGGAPEMNPNLQMFIEELSSTKKILVRTNLTVLSFPEYSHYFDVYKNNRVDLVASLPCYTEENVNKQRGSGVFFKSIAVIKMLNQLGFGTGEFNLDLVYNPGGDCLPGNQSDLEKDYKKNLKNQFRVEFNNLLTLTNVPVKRFKDYLKKENKFDSYMKLLKEQFNPSTLENIMCRFLISVDYDGNVYDCDFNLALDKKVISCESKKFWDIDFFTFTPKITFDDYCYACTANCGSSCHGALVS